MLEYISLFIGFSLFISGFTMSIVGIQQVRGGLIVGGIGMLVFGFGVINTTIYYITKVSG